MHALCCCEMQQLDALSSQEWISREVGLVWWLKERGVGGPRRQTNKSRRPGASAV